MNIERINELAKKAREVGLTEEEKLEQKKLRDEYIAAFRGNLKQTLEQTYIMDAQGNKTKIKKKK